MKYVFSFLALFLILCTSYNSNVDASSSERVVNGLKEALTVGVQEAVKKTGVEDGFYQNPNIKIPLPEQLKKVDNYLKKFGGEAASEALVKKMNRAAEKAAPEAIAIFIKAITDIKIDDGLKILNGGKTAATEYLKSSTFEALINSFSPVIKKSMEEVNGIKTYNDYISKNSLILKSMDINLDINNHVAVKSVEGLFKMIAVEEQKIRENPEARVNDLLKDVFGGLFK
ncbi:MAG: DUF4197 domain-containing protein [Desulfobacterales bacterium]|nr:DUF4197 domain-containing protein [Desulfobacterales bacterium]